MKPISPALKTHLAGQVTTLSTCWKATLKDGTVYGFTDNVKDLDIDGVVYQAASGYTPSNISTSNNLAVDNLELTGLLDSTLISEADIMAGVWDYAKIDIFQVNYNDLSQGKIHLRSGEIGTIKTGGSVFVSELRGLMQNYQNVIGEVTTVTCRAQFADSRCKLDPALYTVTGSITSIISNRIIADSTRSEANAYFAYGKITITSGANEGLSMEVKTYTSVDGVIELTLPFPFPLQIGDTYSMIAGCNKLFDTCKTFNNVINFRGEPHIPGQDKAFRYGTR